MKRMSVSETETEMKKGLGHALDTVRKGGMSAMNEAERWGGKMASALLFLTTGLAMPAFGENSAISLPDVTNTSDVTESIGRIASLSLVIIRWVGVAVAVYGVFEFASAWGQHDSSQQTAAIKKIVSGMLMIIIQPLMVALGILAA